MINAEIKTSYIAFDTGGIMLDREPALDVDRLNAMMERRGWGPIELEGQSGVGYDTIYKIRTSKRPRSSAEILAKLARALGCSLDYLVGLTDDPRPYPPVSLESVSQEFLDVVARLPLYQQRELLVMAKALLDAGQDFLAQDLALNRFLWERIIATAGEETARELLFALGYDGDFSNLSLLFGESE